MICKHSFFKTGEVSKSVDEVGTRPTFVFGVEVVCVNCGQLRQAFSDGMVTVKVDGRKPIDEDVFDDDGLQRFDIPSSPDENRNLLTHLEDHVGIIVRKNERQYFVAPYKKE